MTGDHANSNFTNVLTGNALTVTVTFLAVSMHVTLFNLSTKLLATYVIDVRDFTINPILHGVSSLSYWYTQYDRLLASSCRPSGRLSVCNAVHSGSHGQCTSATLCIVALTVSVQR